MTVSHLHVRRSLQQLLFVRTPRILEVIIYVVHTGRGTFLFCYILLVIDGEGELLVSTTEGEDFPKLSLATIACIDEFMVPKKRAATTTAPEMTLPNFCWTLFGHTLRQILICCKHSVQKNCSQGVFQRYSDHVNAFITLQNSLRGQSLKQYYDAPQSSISGAIVSSTILNHLYQKPIQIPCITLSSSTFGDLDAFIREAVSSKHKDKSIIIVDVDQNEPAETAFPTIISGPSCSYQTVGAIYSSGSGEEYQMRIIARPRDNIYHMYNFSSDGKQSKPSAPAESDIVFPMKLIHNKKRFNLLGAILSCNPAIHNNSGTVIMTVHSYILTYSTYIHTYIHTYIQTYIHTSIHTSIHTYIHRY